MIYRKALLAGVAALTLLAGCSPWAIVTTPAAKGPGGKGTLELPVGWRKVNVANPVMVTRDGFPLNTIALEQLKHKKAFKQTKKESRADMLPQELAENYIAEVKATAGIEGIEVLANEPATVGGRPGFKVHLAYRSTFDSDAIRYQQLVYGVATADGLYIARYSAPVLHYFARDLATFDKVMASFKL